MNKEYYEMMDTIFCSIEEWEAYEEDYATNPWD